MIDEKSVREEEQDVSIIRRSLSCLKTPFMYESRDNKINTEGTYCDI
jgi:hypothetical protein